MSRSPAPATPPVARATPEVATARAARSVLVRAATGVRTLFAALAILGAAPTLRGQAADSATTRADSLIDSASRLAAAGDTSGALRLLATATRAAPQYARAYYERGALLTRTTTLGIPDLLHRREAKQLVMRALELDANNPLYLIELARIKQRTPLLRLEAGRMFRRAEHEAIARGDSAVLAEVEWELGLVNERRFRTGENRRLFSGEMRTFDAEQASSDWQYVPQFLSAQTSPLEDTGEADRREAERHYRAALVADPRHVGAAQGLFALLYGERRFEELVLAATSVARAAPASADARFALGLALHRLDRDAEAERAFDAGLALLPAAERADMTDLAQILPTREAAGYRVLSTAARAEFDRVYWENADPLQLTPANEARVEFLARVAWSALRFAPEEARTPGWRTDRGQVLVRYGEPPVVASFAPEVGVSSGEPARVTVVWYYPDAKHSFVFAGPPAMNAASFAGDFAGIAEDMRISQPSRFNNLPSLRVDSVAVQTARFRGARVDRVDLLVAAAIPTRRLLAGSDIGRASREDAIVLSGADGRDALRSVDTAAVRGIGDEASLRVWQREIDAGNYAYRVESRIPASGRGARARGALAAVPFAAGVLTSSDLLVARSVVPRAPVPRMLTDFAVVPQPSLAFAQRDTMHVYWEAYGLHADPASGAGRYRVELTLTLTDVDRGTNVVLRAFGGVLDATGLSAKGDTRTAIRFERTVPLDASDRTPNYLALDLAGAPPGRYQLSVRTTDLNTGRAVERERTVYVRHP